MFNNSKNSNHSSERSTRRESTQRGPNSPRSRSARSTSSSRHSDRTRTQWKIPLWVHCEKCFVTHDFDPNMSLLSCGHIFCRTCLCSDNPLFTDDPITCLRCKNTVTHRPLDGSLDAKLHGMFEKTWMDPVLQINVRNMQFMMAKTQQYSKFLAKSAKQSANVPPEWVDRYNGAKKMQERNQKLRKCENEINTKTEVIKNEALKKYKNVQMLRSLYQQKKAERQKQQQQQQRQQQQRGQGNYRNDMKFVSSGRNEQSNQYIGQLKAPHHRSANQNHSSPDIRNFSQKVPTPRHCQSLNQYRDTSLKQSSNGSSSRPTDMQSTTFRPKTKEFNSDSRRFESHSQVQKRLVPSYDYDQYSTPSKRAAYYPVQREVNLDTSISSVGSSTILNPLRKYL